MPVPRPQAALTIGPIAMAAGAQPAATGWPLNGATTNQATSVGAMAPNTVAATISRAPSSRASAAARTTPQTPPQKASDQRTGTPKVLVGVNENGALRASWSECRSASAH